MNTFRIANEQELSAYPIGIFQSRYGGVYEGGEWHAIPRYNETIFDKPYEEYRIGDDCDAVDFWGSQEAGKIGVGETPELAISDMWAKISFNNFE